MKTELFFENGKPVTGTVSQVAFIGEYSQTLLLTGTKCKTIKNNNYGKD